MCQQISLLIDDMARLLTKRWLWQRIGRWYQKEGFHFGEYFWYCGYVEATLRTLTVEKNSAEDIILNFLAIYTPYALVPIIVSIVQISFGAMNTTCFDFSPHTQDSFTLLTCLLSIANWNVKLSSCHRYR